MEKNFENFLKGQLKRMVSDKFTVVNIRDYVQDNGDSEISENELEKIISNSYIKKAKQKLAANKNIKVIGITGSYGKTSVKNILGTILSERFKVCATPASYNTPLGLAKTILSINHYYLEMNHHNISK